MIQGRVPAAAENPDGDCAGGGGRGVGWPLVLQLAPVTLAASQGAPNVGKWKTISHPHALSRSGICKGYSGDSMRVLHEKSWGQSTAEG